MADGSEESVAAHESEESLDAEGDGGENEILEEPGDGDGDGEGDGEGEEAQDGSGSVAGTDDVSMGDDAVRT